MPETTVPAFDFGAYAPDFAAILEGVVTDVTDPQLQALLTQLASDAVQVSIAKVSGVPQDEIDRMDAGIRARAQSAAGIPGLIIAGRQQQFLGVVNNVLTGLIGFGFAALRSYIPGAQAAVAAAAAAASSQPQG